MRCKRFPKQGFPFIRESDLGASAIALDIIPLDDALGFQAVQHAGQSTLGHQRGCREFRTGHSVCVAQRGDDVELGRGQAHRPDVAAVLPPAGQVGFHQRAQDFQIGVVFEIRHVHGAIHNSTS